jgi:hypothetical protein
MHDVTAKENLSAQTRKSASSISSGNEVERQRRNLIQENEAIKSRLRACETLLKSGTSERVQFMEGASWMAKKAHAESEHHLEQMNTLVQEFLKRTRLSMRNAQLNEYDGGKVEETKDWISKELTI